MRVKRLYDGKPYKLALNREGYYELRWTGMDGKTKQLSTHRRDLNEARVEAELVWRDYHEIQSRRTEPTDQAELLLHHLSAMELSVKELNEEVQFLRRRVAELEGREKPNAFETLKAEYWKGV
jgi:predicted nuclease with TOPRIM domain